MKFTTNIRNVVTTGVIASAIALSLGFGGSNVFAEGTTPTSVESSTTPSDTQTAPQDSSTTTTTTDQSTTDTQTATDTNQGTASKDSSTATADQQPADTTTTTTTIDNAPSLLPGDFFYFFKTITENIKLALTFNDTDKAVQIAQYAQERLAEANALIKEGKTDLAQETIQKAIEEQKQAEDTAEKSSGDQTTTQDSSKSSGDQTATQDSAPASGDQTATQDSSQTSGDQTAISHKSDLKSQLQAQFGQNILALQTALAKVDNPKAQEALMKNIAKAQEHVTAKVAKKLEKLLKVQTAGDKQTAESEDQKTGTVDQTAGTEGQMAAIDGTDQQAAFTDTNTDTVKTQSIEAHAAATQDSQPAKFSSAQQEKPKQQAATQRDVQHVQPNRPVAVQHEQPKTVTTANTARSSVNSQPKEQAPQVQPKAQPVQNQVAAENHGNQQKEQAEMKSSIAHGQENPKGSENKDSHGKNN